MAPLRDEIKPYTDELGLISPVAGQESGNGLLYLAEYIVIQYLSKELSNDDYDHFTAALIACEKEPGRLDRGVSPDQEGPDDYLGVLVAAYITVCPDVAEDIIDYGWKHFGFFNNEQPGTFTHKDGRFNWSAFLARRLELVCLAYWVAQKRPILPLVIYTALYIFFNSRNTDLMDASPRFIGWMLIQVAKQKSWLCKLATKIWERRLMKDYKAGMKTVSAVYFGAEHPFTKYIPVL
jgi:hypothetical protein